MAAKTSLQSFVGEYYANILLLDPNLNPLTTISSRRAKWYLDRGLANSLGPDGVYNERIQLTFEPKKNSSNKFLQTVLPTQCVMCATKENLTVHHVIPVAVKRFFPKEDKDHTRQWCVLLCEKHHLEAEKTCRPFYEKGLQAAVREAQVRHHDKNKLLFKLANVLNAQNLITQAVIESLTSEELGLYGAFLQSLSTPPDSFKRLKELIMELRAAQKKSVKAAKAEWGARYIIENGGVQGIKEIYRVAFLKLNPEFLPEGFLVDSVELICTQ